MVLDIVTIYLLIGLIFALVGPLSRSLQSETRYVKKVDAAPNWKVLSFFILLAMGIIILWPFFAPGAFKQEKKKALREISELNRTMTKLNDSAIDADEFPNGIGEFGFSLSNPIPCNSVLGTNRYLSQLKTVRGAIVAYSRIGSFASDITQMPVDGYRIEAEGVELGTIYISPYEKRNSCKAPKGLILDGRS